MLTLKQTLGAVALLASILACIAATLRPSNSTSGFSGGMLFALTVALCSVGIARLIHAFPNTDRFWIGFVLTCTVCFLVSLSDRLMSLNTAPEHLTRLLLKLAPYDSSVSVHQSNERFYAMQGVITNATVLVLAFGCGIIAQLQPRGQSSQLTGGG